MRKIVKLFAFIGAFASVFSLAGCNDPSQASTTVSGHSS
jgi:hypothetical protein